jgi:hypothetical protein
MLKREIYQRHPELRTMPNNVDTCNYMINCAISTWDAMEQEFLHRYLDTMPHRVQAVLNANGWYTKY